MKKRLRLVLALALLGIASRSFASDYPICAVIDGTPCEDGRVVCEDGADTGACTCVNGYWGCLYSGGGGWW